jgi:hypothetical protein
MALSNNIDEAESFAISDADLEDMLYDDAKRRKKLNLHLSSGDSSWEIFRYNNDYDNGSFVLRATTRDVIRGIDANAGGFTTYHGMASMSITIDSGELGGTLYFAINTGVHVPIDVLEITLDGLPVVAVTSPTQDWEELTLEISPGEHVVEFRHISNPTSMSESKLETMGQPGSSMIDGLKYVDHNDLIPTLEPTPSPTAESEEPTLVPTPNMDTNPPSLVPTPVDAVSTSSAIQTQNYCGTSLTLIKDTCQTADAPQTCNEGDGPCPAGTFCFGGVNCATLGENAGNQELLEPLHSPGNQDEDEVVATEENSGSSQANPANQEVAKEDDEESTPANELGCPEGLLAVEDLPGCCVPDASFLGDGACDPDAPFNTVECGYDLGDCCKESCNTDTLFGCKSKEGDEFGPFGYFCVDPQYTNIDEEECTAENREWIGDGGCDPEYNTSACDWDGGDCCKETCDSEFSYYECGREIQPYDCKDPNIIYVAGYVP